MRCLHSCIWIIKAGHIFCHLNLQVHHETNSPSIILQKGPAFNLSQQWSGATMPVASTQINSVISSNIAKCNGNSSLASSPLAVGKAIELTLLDERSLLACIVRAIPAGSGNGIRISSTVSIFC